MQGREVNARSRRASVAAGLIVYGCWGCASRGREDCWIHGSGKRPVPPPTLEEAWRMATEHAPQGWFGPRVEMRGPRWRAWYENPRTSREFDAWALTETDALLALMAEREAELD